MAKKIFLGLALLLIVGIIVTVSALGIMEYKTQKINNDYASIFTEEKYAEAVFVDGIEIITQSITCGYATIEMFSAWNGGSITEEALFEEYGKVVTSTGKAFAREMNKQFPEYSTTMYSYLTNTELLDKVYQNLSKGIPVPFAWAAKYGDEWTLHYSLITALDVQGNSITILNPYGYVEKLRIGDFLARTRFDAYEVMPFYFKLAFAFGLFEKNTIFIVE